MSIDVVVAKSATTERLTRIYCSVNAGVYSFGDSQAIVKLDNSCVIVRPWAWGETKPIIHDYRGEFPTDDYQMICEYLAKVPDDTADMTIGSLAFWSSRRRLHSKDYPEDAQYVGSKKFDRRLIREVVQTWIELGTVPTERVLIETLRATDGNPSVRFSCSGIQAIVMGLREQAECGNDPLPAEWRDVRKPSAIDLVDAFRVISTASTMELETVSEKS